MECKASGVCPYHLEVTFCAFQEISVGHNTVTFLFKAGCIKFLNGKLRFLEGAANQSNNGLRLTVDWWKTMADAGK